MSLDLNAVGSPTVASRIRNGPARFAPTDRAEVDWGILPDRPEVEADRAEVEYVRARTEAADPHRAPPFRAPGGRSAP